MSGDPTEPQPAAAKASNAGSQPVRPELMNWQVLEEESRRAYFARGAPSRARAAAAAGERGANDSPAAGATLPNALPPPDSTDETDAIDGQVILIAERPNTSVPLITASTAAPPDLADLADLAGLTDDNSTNDQVDSILIAALPERRIVVKPGGTATMVVSLLNNGTQNALFDVHVEGWIHESWLAEPPHPVMLRPGERAAATITLAPPRSATTTAGEFPIYVVVRSTQYLRRNTRLGATLVIEPFTEFSVGQLMPSTASLGAFRRSAVFALAANNLSNHVITLNLQGQAAGLPCNFAFRRAATLQTARGDGGWQPDPVLLDLQPDETADLLVRVSVTSAPLFGTRPVVTPFRLVASVEGEARPPRTAAGDLAYTPPVRAWHLLAAGLASLMLMALMGLLALGARVLLESSRATPQSAASAPVAPVVIVLNQSPPASSGASSTAGTMGTVGRPATALPSVAPAAVAATSAGASTGNGLPLVQPNMVTRPGEAAPAAAAPTAAGATTALARGGPRAAAPAPYTYAEMFQQVALTYDLDWRLLAAQAYVESGFDTLALGADGDMGLMQVLPSTWREWAPAVGASDPFDANANTLVAAAYLDHVRSLMGKRGLPQAQWMLVAYNWGPDRLGQFLDGGGIWEQLPPERAQYAADILRIARTIP